MSKITYDQNRCKGCHFCVTACPHGVITVPGEVNKKGYHIVEFNEAACKACGICYRMCPDYAIVVSMQRGA